MHVRKKLKKTTNFLNSVSKENNNYNDKDAVLKVLESYFSIYFLMENSILYAKIAVSEKKNPQNTVLNII